MGSSWVGKGVVGGAIVGVVGLEGVFGFKKGEKRVYLEIEVGGIDECGGFGEEVGEGGRGEWGGVRGGEFDDTNFAQYLRSSKTFTVLVGF